MFDHNGEMICWFDTENQAEAIGIPEGALKEFMFSIVGPIATTERAYACDGRVKAVIIKDYGLGAAQRLTVDPLESLRDFAWRFGLTCISRPRSGMGVEHNGGRYYSPGHGDRLITTAAVVERARLYRKVGPGPNVINPAT